MTSPHPRISARVSAIAESATLAVDTKAKALRAAGRARGAMIPWRDNAPMTQPAAPTPVPPLAEADLNRLQTLLEKVA